MKAIFEDRTRQYTVNVGDIIAIDRMSETEDGKKLTFDKVMMITKDNNETVFGAPFISGSKVTASVIDNAIRDDKVIVFKFKRRKNYKRFKGHKQPMTLIKIEDIKA